MVDWYRTLLGMTIVHRTTDATGKKRLKAVLPNEQSGSVKMPTTSGIFLFADARHRPVPSWHARAARQVSRRWARIGAPRYVALALAAVLKDIPPWKPAERPRARKELD